MSNNPEEPRTGLQVGGRWNLWFALGTLVFVALCLLVWFPRDIASGFLQKNLTGGTVPGDSFFPVLLVLLMVPLALLLLLNQLSAKGEMGGEPVGKIGFSNLGFLVKASSLTALSVVVINWTGPIFVWLSNSLGLIDVSGYRAVSATFPYDISGFMVGGTLLTCGFIWLTRQRLRPIDILIGIATAAILVLLFDGLLINIQLPPNADL